MEHKCEGSMIFVQENGDCFCLGCGAFFSEESGEVLGHIDDDANPNLET